MDRLGRSAAAGGDTGAHRAVPGVDGGARAGGLDGRSATVDGVWLLPIRSPRRSRPGQPGAPGAPSRGELAAFLYTAERISPAHAALAVLLGLNGLRVSEARGSDIDDLGFERGHRTLRIVGKGNQPAVVPLVPRTARTIDLAIGERAKGPILVRHDGGRLDPRTAHRWVRSIGQRAALDGVHPHTLRAAFIMAALDAGVPLRDVQRAARHADPRTTTIYDRRRQNLDRHAAYAVVAFVTHG